MKQETKYLARRFALLTSEAEPFDTMSDGEIDAFLVKLQAWKERTGLRFIADTSPLVRGVVLDLLKGKEP